MEIIVEQILYSTEEETNMTYKNNELSLKDGENLNYLNLGGSLL